MNRILEELAVIKQELEFNRVEMQELRVELTRILTNQQADNEANKKKLTNSGNYSNDLPDDWRSLNPIFKPMKSDGQR